MESEYILHLVLAEGLGAETSLCTLEEAMFTEAEQIEGEKSKLVKLLSYRPLLLQKSFCMFYRRVSFPLPHTWNIVLEQVRQCTYNVKVMCVCVTKVTVEKQLLLNIWVKFNCTATCKQYL